MVSIPLSNSHAKLAKPVCRSWIFRYRLMAIRSRTPFPVSLPAHTGICCFPRPTLTTPCNLLLPIFAPLQRWQRFWDQTLVNENFFVERGYIWKHILSFSTYSLWHRVYTEIQCWYIGKSFCCLEDMATHSA